MAVDRPTFSESWYRVADLRPRLRSTIQAHRQHFRGQMWYVLQDPASNEHFRVNVPAYRFVGLLDGRRTVAEVWRACNEQLGDGAPTQGEAIQLLGQLYSSNLLQAEMSPDAEGLFRRYHKRRTREVQSYLTNVLFIRIPLVDPDHFLNRWVGIFGRFFSWYGLFLWLALIVTALYFLIGRTADLTGDAYKNILSPENLPLLYLSIVGVKICHELSHCFACKRFGRAEGGAGEVHVLGVMFLVFTPLPYMDASAAHTFRSKWRRVVVGCAGMFAELAIAAIAAIVWSQTSVGTIRAVCYNIMFTASLWTLLFNANPLLRFDGYFILTDLLEIPNLYQRSKEYLQYLVKKYIWGVRRPRNPANTPGERAWFVLYGVASTIYRVFILFRILMFLTDRLPVQLRFVAVAFAVVSGAMWVCIPTGKFIRYLATNGELLRVRGRAMITTVVFLAAVVIGTGMIPIPDRHRLEGIVEPVNMNVVYAGTDGILRGFRPPSATPVDKGATLVQCENPDLTAEHEILLAERGELEVQLHVALTRQPETAHVYRQQIAALDENIARVADDLRKLKPRAPLRGVWVAPQIDQAIGSYLRRGAQIGLVADVHELRIRAVADQPVAAMLEEAQEHVEIRVKGRPDLRLSGRKSRILPAGLKRLPSAALGFGAGGSTRVTMDDKQGTTAAESYFEVQVSPDDVG